MQKVSGNVVQQFIDPNSNVKFIIVAEKLQTGTTGADKVWQARRLWCSSIVYSLYR